MVMIMVMVVVRGCEDAAYMVVICHAGIMVKMRAPVVAYSGAMCGYSGRGDCWAGV